VLLLLRGAADKSWTAEEVARALVMQPASATSWLDQIASRGLVTAAVGRYRYWRLTRDRLFAMFAAGFLTFAVSRVILAFLDEDDEGRVIVYAFRLLAFALILAAIIDKNRSSRPAGDGSQNGSRPKRVVERASRCARAP
jgi:hypothetical protein